MGRYQYGKTKMGGVTCSICFEPFTRASDILYISRYIVEYNICNITCAHLIHKICLANKLLKLLTGKMICYQWQFQHIGQCFNVSMGIKHGQLWKIFFETANEIYNNYNFAERMKKIDWKSSDENKELSDFGQVWTSLGMADVTCSICLEPMTPKCDLSFTPCMHLFHTICIKKKLQNPIFKKFGLNFPSQLMRMVFATLSQINDFNERVKRPDSEKKSRDPRPHTKAFSKNIYLQKLNLEKWSKTFLKFELDFMNQFYQKRVVLAKLKLIKLEDDLSFEDLKKFDKNLQEEYERLKIKLNLKQQAQTAQEAQAGQAVQQFTRTIQVRLRQWWAEYTPPGWAVAPVDTSLKVNNRKSA